jgi:hypothetical protein
LVDGNDVFLSRTVILECEWVLRSAYGYSPREICRKLRAFTGLPTVFTEDHPVVARALDHAEDGMDFADAKTDWNRQSLRGVEELASSRRGFAPATPARTTDQAAFFFGCTSSR